VNRYRVRRSPDGWPESLPFTLQLPDGNYGVGEEFDYEFTEEDERSNLDSGLLEIVPRTYKVMGGSDVYETKPGETFDAAIPVGIEALLYAGGHIERVDEPTTPTKKAKG
jgi:hypothetical protein